MRFAILPFLLVGFFLGGCIAKKDYNLFYENGDINTSVSGEEHQAEVEFEWKIAKGDRIDITVFNQSSGGGTSGAQLNQLLSQGGQSTFSERDGTEAILISKKGTVHLPLVGLVEITGLTEEEAAIKLTEEYKKYLRNPYVTVKILNQKLFVLGEVKRPGVVQVTHGTMSLFEAIAHVGDLTDGAERTNLKIIRGNLKNPRVREVDLTDMSAIRLSSLILQPNDIVYIQPRTMKAYNVGFTEQMPFFDLLTRMMSPFVGFAEIKKEYNIASGVFGK